MIAQSPWLRHPLLHFCLLGLLAFGAYRLLRPLSPRSIVISDETLAGLTQDFARRNGRPPTAVERAGVVRDYIDSEVLFREAQSRGLGDGDLIIRRRLIQKMEFVAEAMGGEVAPRPGELEAYLGSHADRYREPDRVSLRHVFVSRDRHGEKTAEIAAELGQKLAAGADAATLGDPFLRGPEFRALSLADAAGIFGKAFAAALPTLEIDRWSTPQTSSYGLHLVKITSRLPEALPPLSAIRDRVRADFESDRRLALRRAALDRLRQRYEISLPPAERGSR